MRPRISIARLLGLIVAFGVALAALRSPSNLWANALVTLTLAALVVAVINVVYSRARVRAFWVGFLIAGAAYFLLHGCHRSGTGSYRCRCSISCIRTSSRPSRRSRSPGPPRVGPT
jgi:hypothetical protein